MLLGINSFGGIIGGIAPIIKNINPTKMAFLNLELLDEYKTKTVIITNKNPLIQDSLAAKSYLLISNKIDKELYLKKYAKPN